MPKFRSKPTEVEAMQWTDTNPFVHPGVKQEVGPGPYVGRYFIVTMHNQPAYLADGDWIVAEPVADRFYPIKPDVFAKKYEPVQ